MYLENMYCLDFGALPGSLEAVKQHCISLSAKCRVSMCFESNPEQLTLAQPLRGRQLNHDNRNNGQSLPEFMAIIVDVSAFATARGSTSLI